MKNIDPSTTPCFNVSLEATNPHSPECPVHNTVNVRNVSFAKVVAENRYEAVKRVAEHLSYEYGPKAQWEILSESLGNTLSGNTMFIRFYHERNKPLDIIHVEVERCS